ncbi:MAG: hypothetical protein PHO13_06990 [Fermentimonas sp.]|jgi:hypothetical protein|nr:hypothetical protein [Fermentimonas sp.]NLC85327.1 hypothetical protein [Bacteroidales bacterium]HBT85060.1 hypothetical protein [Porphyromonadaceae bacterium]MDD2930723.1 hypothetical protein [Fermentimonas sp.]MDD3189227.1 hypothetical protein [Fermentimonas sp.]
MSKYKLDPLEELRLEKKRQREERKIASQRLSYQLQYLNDNWGSMLTKGVTSSIKSKFSDTMDNFSTSSSTSVTPFITKVSNPWLNNTITQIILSNLPLIGSVTWNIAKPALIAFGARKITSILFGRKRKK